MAWIMARAGLADIIGVMYQGGLIQALTADILQGVKGII